MQMTNPKQNIKDTKKAYQMALSWRKHHRSAASFEAFIKSVWPTGCERLGKNLGHIIAFVWEL